MKDTVTQQEVVDKVKAADNILIMTSSRADVDQLASCIGLFRILREMDKNPALVYSKDVPGAINFLEPQKAIQADTESLRDFIISFDRKKVDKFRYNQEGEQYNILLTPSRLEMIAKDDIKYRKGDFNIELILAIGIDSQANVDPAVSEHKQLMDELPLINIISGRKSSSWEASSWQNTDSPAVAEMVYELGKALGVDSFSKQIANALLTGIIDQTDRYKTKQTKPRTMHVSADLLEMGADLQLINENLAKAGVTPTAVREEETKEMIEEALGETGEYDTKLIKNRKKKKASASDGRQYMKQGDVGESGISYGEAAAKQKTEEQEYKLDKLNIDEEGNLRIVSEEEETQPAAANKEAAAPALAADTAPALAADTASANVSPAAAPAVANASDSAQSPAMVSRGIQAPAARSSEFTPHPALGGSVPSPAGAAQAQAPSISEIVDKAASVPAAPVVPAAPSLNEKVAAMSPGASANPNSYIDSLAGGSPAAPASVNPAPNPAVANPNQALTVDSYLAQQQSATAPNPAAAAAPVAPNPAAVNNPYTPPAAPPLASMT